MVEEQLEAATHTIIQDMKPSFEKLIALFENEVKTLVEVSPCQSKMTLNVLFDFHFYCFLFDHKLAFHVRFGLV